MIRYQKGGAFTPVSWQEAIRYTASKLREIKEKHGPRTIMTTGSSRGTGNETNYVMQKFARAVLNTNNVDCCARVCHGPSVAGLQQALGNGAMSNSISDIENSKCLLVFGYNCRRLPSNRRPPGDQSPGKRRQNHRLRSAAH